MAVEKFNFVSPGVQVAEIDRSGSPATAPAIGPAVIGRAPKGPGLVPTRIESINELYALFGQPSAGGRTGDVWRNGNLAAPTNGLYAAEAYLRNNGPITFVRLVGDQAPADVLVTNSGEAGWDFDKAVGLFFANSTSGSSVGIDNVTASLGAIIYCDTDADVYLVSGQNNQTSSNADYQMYQSDVATASDMTYTLIVSSSLQNHLTATFNLDPNSDLYIRNVLNTNPHFTNETLYPTGAANYFLGETFESSIAEQVVGSRSGAPTSVGEGNVAWMFRASLQSGTVDHSARQSKASAAKTGYVLAQDLSTDISNYNPASMQKLFRFVSTDIRGEWDNRNLKISVANITAPTNPTVDPYGFFDVLVREASDTDNKPAVLEQFTGLTLNPNSNDYIARRIGDQYYEWDSNEKLYNTYGTYENNSKFIRVEMIDEVDNATTNPAFLPAGFYGPLRYVGQPVSGAGPSSKARNIDGTTGFLKTGNLVTASYSSGGEVLTNDFTSSISFPKMVLRQSGSDGVSTTSRASYGVKAEGTIGRRDNGYSDYLVRLSSALDDAHIASASQQTEYSFIFSLDDISGSTTAPVYVSGSRKSGESLRGTGDFDTLLAASINSFTMPLSCGTDGFDITEPEPFANRLLTDKDDGTSSEFYSLRKAIDTIRDSEVVEHNVCAVPGIYTTGITDYLIDMAEERRDTLAVIDIENDLKNRFEQTTQPSLGGDRITLPNVSNAISSMKSRAFNTSYAAAYYPAVQIADGATGARLYVPATVAAIAAYGSTDGTAAPWFAPAGFNRGGLSDSSSGITATGVAKRLTSKERDELYEVNINPIAHFPQEGVVIFGQKTLLADRTALDRINVRRLLIYLKKEISRIANSTLFEPNVRATWNNFTSRVKPLLDSVKADFGLEDYRLILDETTTTPELIDRNVLYARVLLKPTRTIEYIALDFEVFRSGASFDD
jgi:hypothetical protein